MIGSKEVLWILVYILSTFSYLGDVISDTILGFRYLDEGHTNWAIATLTFVFVPGFINAAIGLVILLISKKFHAATNWVTPCIGIVMSFCFVGPLFWDLMAILLLLGCFKKGSQRKTSVAFRRSSEAKRSMDLFIDHDLKQCDIWGSVQRAIEAVLEAAPQTLLQVYVMGRSNRVSGLQVLSLFSSMGTAAFSLTLAMFEVSRGGIYGNSAFGVVWTPFSFAWSFLLFLCYIPAVSLFASLRSGAMLFLFSMVYLQFFFTAASLTNIYFVCLSCLLHILLTGGVFLISILWYLKMQEKNVEEVGSSYANYTSKYPTMPSFVWPDTASELTTIQDWLSDFHIDRRHPEAYFCNRTELSRNGLLVEDPGSWWRQGDISENFSALWGEKLFCLSQIQTPVFLIVFYSNLTFALLHPIWLACCCFYHCCQKEQIHPIIEFWNEKELMEGVETDWSHGEKEKHRSNVMLVETNVNYNPTFNAAIDASDLDQGLHQTYSGIDLDQSMNRYHITHSNSSENPPVKQETDFHDSFSENGFKTRDGTQRGKTPSDVGKEEEAVYENLNVLYKHDAISNEGMGNGYVKENQLKPGIRRTGRVSPNFVTDN